MRLRGHITTHWIVSTMLGGALLATSGCGPDEPASRRELDPQGATLLAQAQRAYLRGGYERALALLDSAEAFVAETPDLWFLRGVVLTEMYRFDESDEALQHARDLDETFRSVRFNLGHNAFLQSAVFARNEYRTALRYYRDEERLLRRAIRRSRDPKDVRGLSAVLTQIGTTYARINRPDSARATFTEAIAVDSSNALAFSSLASLQRDAGEFEPALQNALRAAELDARNAQYRMQVGMILFELERYEEALPYLLEAERHRPWDPTAVYALGNVLVELDSVDRGRALLLRADTLEELRSSIDRAHMRLFKNPSDPIRWENYAYLLHRAGRTAEARKAINVMMTLPGADSLIQ